MDDCCRICKLSRENDAGSVLFQAPNEDKKRKAWSKACGVVLTRNCLICQDHFDSNDIIGRRNGVRLKANALPIHDNVNKELELSKAKDGTEDSSASANIKTEPPELVLVNRNAPTENNKELESAFFDVNVKVETNEAPEPLMLIHEARFDEENSNVGAMTVVKSSEKRICGQVEIVDEKGDEIFQLKCICCEKEYKISDYTYFIEHIKTVHRRKETADVQANKTSAMCLDENVKGFNEIDSAEKDNEVLGKDRLIIVADGIQENNIEKEFDEGNEESSADELQSEQSELNSDCSGDEYEPKCKKPNKEKKQRSCNETTKRTKENLVFFDHPEKQCVLDFLELIKSNAILWHRRQSIMKRFDNAVEKITAEFNLKWPGYQMTHEQSRNSINRIKDLYQRVSDATHKRHIKNSTHLKKYPKYFEICAEIEEESKKVTNPCDNCRAFFFNEIDLQVHKVKRHRIGELPFKCSRCKYGFSKAEKLSEHEQKHHRVKTFTCEVCSKGFFDESKLRAHEATHSNDYKPVCEVCGEMFKNYSKYRRHRLHHEPPKEKCKICGKLYYEKWNLSEHVKSHKNERLYQCDICHKSFNHRNGVTIHKRGVHNVKPQPQKYIWVKKDSLDYNDDGNGDS